MKIILFLGVLVASLIAITSFDDAFAQYYGNVGTENPHDPVFDIVYNDLLFKITGYEKDHVYFSKFFEDGVHMSTEAYTIDESKGGDTWTPLEFGFEGQDAILEWKWYYDENYFIELDSITWNRAQATPTPSPVTESASSPYGNSITPVVNSGIPSCETTSTGCYTPNPMTIAVGNTVTFYNSDVDSHTFTAGKPSDGPNGKFDTGLLTPGESFEFSPDEPGNIPFFCTLHPWMVGMIMVEHSNFSKPSSISVFTNDISYHGKEHIEIYGTVTKSSGSTFVRIIVDAPSGFTVYDSIDTMNFGGEYTFDRIVVPDEPLWKEGTYVVTASYGTSDHKARDVPDNVLATTTFEFTGFAKTSTDYNTFNNKVKDDYDSSPKDDYDSSPKDDYDSSLEKINTSEPEELGGNMGNVGSNDETGSYTLEEAFEIQRIVNAAAESNSLTDYPPLTDDSTKNLHSLVNQNEKRIDAISKKLDSLSEKKVKLLDSKINREESQYDEYLKQYNYYDGKTLSLSDEKKFQSITTKLNSQQDRIISLIDDRNTIIFESEFVSESVEDKVVSPQPTENKVVSPQPTENKAVSPQPTENKVVSPQPTENKVVSPQPSKIDVKYKKEPTCFLFWCW